VSVNLLDEALDAELLAIKLELLAILCTPTLVFSHRVRGVFAVENVLNLTDRDAGSVEFLLRRTVLMVTPVVRADGGMVERKSLAVRACGEKGLKRVVISVMNFVIILGRRVTASAVSCGR
jgi:hypothetical protein